MDKLKQNLLNLQSNLNRDSNSERSDDNSSLLWSIEDTLFCAQGLINHSIDIDRSVFVTWNEKYLLNFIFKSIQNNAKRTTKLTKVRVVLPKYFGEYEEINQMLILDFNTFLLMQSGRVYYFNSVKSVSLIPWLTDVRYLSAIKTSGFSIIRCKSFTKQGKEVQKKQLYLEVYIDLPNMGNNTLDELLLRSYDITFDDRNIFQCDWSDTRYTLSTFIVNDENYTLLNKLAHIKQSFLDDSTPILDLQTNQEIHIFTVSGNIFILIGAISDKDVSSKLPNKDITDYTIHLLNSYVSLIECVKFQFAEEMMVVLLDYGYLDIWYSNKVFNGALMHKIVYIVPYMHYDYCNRNQAFYFVSREQVSQLRIKRKKNECIVDEEYMSIGGMVACTWVEHLQQLVCLSCNNIFYRLNFKLNEKLRHLEMDNTTNKTESEKYQNLYTLNDENIQNLLKRVDLIKNLLKKPKILEELIENELQKQLVLGMAEKSEKISKLFTAYLEYHLEYPIADIIIQQKKDFKEMTLIKVNFNNNEFCIRSNDYHALIFIKLCKKTKAVLSLMSKGHWYLQISHAYGYQLIHVPSHVFQRSLCLVIKYMKNDSKISIENFRIRLTTFVNHSESCLTINFPIDIQYNGDTFKNLFLHKIQHIPCTLNSIQINHIEEFFWKKKSERKIYEITTEEKEICKHYFPLNTNWNHILKSINITEKDCSEGKFSLYYLGQYLIQLAYDNEKKIILITSAWPEAVFHFKLQCLLVIKQHEDIQCITENISNSKLLKTVMKFQFDMDNIFADSTMDKFTLNIVSSSDVHLEVLRTIYSKLRQELSEVFR